ncbi:MAG TPA: TlpA disulfide reductase family protein [Cyclobacteriaceae bacterium]
MRLSIVLAISTVLIACSSKPKPVMKAGIWRGTIAMQGQVLPFNFSTTKDSSGKWNAYLKNGEENLLLDEISIHDDSVTMNLHIFDSKLVALIDGDSLKGFFIKNYDPNYKLPFKAAFGQDYRFAKTDNQSSSTDFSGKYAVTFIHEKDTTQAIGIFKQDHNHVTGSFLTPTGDYRFLEGSVINNVLHLSTFDGNYAYLFTAEKKDGILRGEYWSGKSRYETWTGIKNENASLPDAESLTYLKPGYDKIDFKFPDVDGKIISLSDAKYKNKVVILQLFGTWCPNCMDETKFLAPWYKINQSRGVEIIGLAYERKDDFTYASARVKKMKDKLSVDYDFVIAGTNDKAKAALTLPMLSSVVAFPTTIFIGRDGKVKKIHTGFSGPGTGVYYDEFIQQFNNTMNELLKENVN